MSDETFTPTTCRHCLRGFDLANPWTQLHAETNFARCVHCGEWTAVEPESMAKARARRESGKS